MFDVLKWLDDAPIKLTSGVGTRDSGGCWMAALSVYSGAAWGDHPPCVDPTIRSLAIACNDMISTDEARGRIISPHLLEPVGTATDDKEVVSRRMWIVVDAAVRIFAPHALRSCGLVRDAERLESLPLLKFSSVDAAARAARAAAAARAAYAARAAADAYAAARAADAAADAYAAARAADAAADAYAAARAADAAADAAYAAADAADAAADAYAADAAADTFAEKVVMPVILEMCQIGNPTPKEPHCTVGEIAPALQCTVD